MIAPLRLRDLLPLYWRVLISKLRWALRGRR